MLKPTWLQRGGGVGRQAIGYIYVYIIYLCTDSAFTKLSLTLLKGHTLPITPTLTDTRMITGHLGPGLKSTRLGV